MYLGKSISNSSILFRTCEDALQPRYLWRYKSDDNAKVEHLYGDIEEKEGVLMISILQKASIMLL